MKVNALAVNRKGEGSCQRSFEAETYDQLEEAIAVWLDSPGFPFYKIDLELEADGWEPTAEDQAKLTLIEEGEYK